MDKYQLVKEILSLADSNPMQLVDIAPIVDKYTEGIGVEQQRPIRIGILAALRELKSYGEIELIESGSSISTTTAGVYTGSSMKFRSTYKRVKELEEKSKQQIPTISIGRDMIGSVAGNHLEDSRITLSSPEMQMPKKTPKTRAKTTSLVEYIYWVAGILLTIIAVWEFALKRLFHQP